MKVKAKYPAYCLKCGHVYWFSLICPECGHNKEYFTVTDKSKSAGVGKE